jgi:hypothetical protein
MALGAPRCYLGSFHFNTMSRLMATNPQARPYAGATAANFRRLLRSVATISDEARRRGSQP